MSKPIKTPHLKKRKNSKKIMNNSSKIDLFKPKLEKTNKINESNQLS